MSYVVRVICRNCGAEESVEIPDGKEVSSQTCPTCGCKTLARAQFSAW